MCFCISANAQVYGQRTFESVGSDQDIPFGVITSLMQDKKGFIWIGTQRGLIRYDGFQFKALKHNTNNNHSLSGNFIRVIKQDKNGLIWVGTQSNGFSVFDPKTEIFTHYKHDKKSPTSLSNNQVRDIFFDGKSRWIATANGLNLLKEGQTEFQHFFHKKDQSLVNSVLIDSKGQMWLGTKNGLYTFDQIQKTFSKIPLQQDFAITAIKQISADEIWIGTKENGILIINIRTVENNSFDVQYIKQLSHPWVSDILKVTAQEVWVATLGGGINIFNPVTKEKTEQIQHDAAISKSLNLDSISSLLLDKSGLLWIGSWGKGLNKYNSEQNAFRVIKHSPSNPNSLSHPDVYSILELQDGRWVVGTGGHGIDILDKNFVLLKNFKGADNSPLMLPKGIITSLAQTANNFVWIGTNNHGLFRLHLDTMSLLHFSIADGLTSNSFYKILPDGNNLWLATKFGLNYLDTKSGKVSHFFDENNKPFTHRIHTLAYGAENQLWIGTSDGLYLLTHQQKLIRFSHQVNDPNSISNNHIMGLLLDSKNNLWVDTSSGLNKLVTVENNKAIFETINYQHAKPDYYFGANMLEDEKGKIWTQWSQLSPTNLLLTEISKSEGADAGTVWLNSFAKSKSGLLIYGGTEGILVINPNQYKYRTYQPSLGITEIEVDGKKQVVSNHITISSQQMGFSVEFSALDFYLPESNLYAHKLIGVNDDWIIKNANNRRVTYTNLKPGTYELLLRVSDHLGLWNNKKHSIKITVLPSYYQTFTFKITIMTLLIVIFYAFYLLKTSRLKKAKIDLEQQVKARTLELADSHKSLTMLSEIGKEITSTQSINSVLEKIYLRTNQLMPSDIFSIGIHRNEEDFVEIAISIKHGIKYKPYKRSMKDENQLIVWCINNRQPILINDVNTELPTYINANDWESIIKNHPIDGFNTMQSHLYVPLIAKSETVGAIAVHSLEMNAYNKQMLEQLKTLATYAAIAIDNANKMQKLDWANQSLKAAQMALELSYKKLEETSVTDQLTGLKNRHFLVSNIDRDVKKSLREYKSLQIAKTGQLPINADIVFFIIDLDLFKRINDNYGHQAGDSILVEMKNILEDIFRDIDYIVRWGGEEFLVVARYTERAKAPILAERIRKAVEEFPFIVKNDIPIKQTCSIGFACFPFVQKFEPVLTWEQVIEIADVCLYAAKNTSRNAWVGVYGLEDINCTKFMERLDQDPKKLLSLKQMRLECSLKNIDDIIWRTE